MERKVLLSNFKKIAFIIEHSSLKGHYPFFRASVLAQALERQANLFIFTKGASALQLNSFIEQNQTPIQFSSWKELLPTIRTLQLDAIVLDSEDTPKDVLQLLSTYCKNLIFLDYFGDGASIGTVHLKGLQEDEFEMHTENEVNGPYFFIPPASLSQIRSERLFRATPITSTQNPPHIAIFYEDGDRNNLTYRTVRHLVQLQIPLQISIILDDNYAHSLDALSMIVLTRKNCKIVRGNRAIEETLVDADCLICNSLYTPYKAATIQIPCITVAQHERELKLVFPHENNGFIHIGLGRKMKQSQLQNAVMELLLHDSIRKTLLKRQQAHHFEHNLQLFSTVLLDIANGKFDPSVLQR